MTLFTAEKHGWQSLRLAVLSRDERTCIGARLGADHACADEYGSPHFKWEYDHVKEQPMAGRKAPNDEAHLVLICPWHHRVTVAGSTWSTANREAERAYLKEQYPDIWSNKEGA